jgi:hypothetical protein
VGKTPVALGLTPDFALEKTMATKKTKKQPRATHDGTLRIGDVELPCAVLDNGMRVFVRSALSTALIGYKPRRTAARQEVGVQVPDFLAQKNLSAFVSKHLRSEYRPIKFVGKTGRVEDGLPAAILPVICRVFIDAGLEGVLRGGQQRTFAKCQRLAAALMDVGAEALVDEVTEFQKVRSPHHLQNLLDVLLQDEPLPWQKRFPDSFWFHIYRLRGWNWHGMAVNRPQVCAHYVCDFIYERMDESLLPALMERAERDEKGNLLNNLHQFLTERVGQVALANHLDKVIMIMKASPTWDYFVQQMNAMLPRKGHTLEMFAPQLGQ